MVYFICDGCGETLKKSKVDQHAQRCRNCDSVSCVDCNVVFYGDDYRGHTSCVSEAEKYQKSLYNGKKKGEENNRNGKKNLSEEWTNLIVEASKTAPISLRVVLEKISLVDNVPRKEKQFRNFLSNSFRFKNTLIVTKIWEHLMALSKSKRTTKSVEIDVKTKSVEIDVKTKCDEIDVKEKCETKQTQYNTNKVKSKHVAKAMRKVLKKEPKKKLKLKELRKRVKTKLLFKGKKDELKALIMNQLKIGKIATIENKKIVKLKVEC